MSSLLLGGVGGLLISEDSLLLRLVGMVLLVVGTYVRGFRMGKWGEP